MTLDTIALGGGGIVVSLLTFWLGYRQTIGAKQERIRSTNDEIEATVLKRILLEKMSPSVDDLRRFITGKAIAARLERADIRSVSDLAALLWTRVVENDLVPPERRQEILAEVFPIEDIAQEMSPAPPSDLQAGEGGRLRQRDRRFFG